MAGKSAAANKDKDNNRPDSRASRADLQVPPKAKCSRGSSKLAYTAWASLPTVPKDLVTRTGLNIFFDGLSGHDSLQLSAAIIQALREYWWDTTHSFHFSWGELTVTPGDFTALTGLRFGGKPLRCDNTLIGDMDRQHELLGFHIYDILRGYGVPYGHLRKRFDDLLVRHSQGGATNEQVARAFLWYGLSHTIFANGGTNAMIPLLGALEDLTAVGYYAWGAAGLAELYRALDHCCRNSAGSFDGFGFVLEAWAFEVLGLCNFTTTLPSNTFPAMLRWVPDARRKPSKRAPMHFKYSQLKTILGGEFRDEYHVFPWNDIIVNDVMREALKATAQRRLLIGLSGDAVYLGERVFRQHNGHGMSWVPHDPPCHMLSPDKLKGRDQLLIGIDAMDFIDMGEVHDDFTSQSFGGSRDKIKVEQADEQAELKEASKRTLASSIYEPVIEKEAPRTPPPPPHGSIYEPVIEKRTCTYVDEDFEIKTGVIDVPEELPDRYRVPASATSVSIKAYEEVVRHNIGMRGIIKKLHKDLAKLRLRSSPPRKRHAGGPSSSRPSDY